MDIHANALEIIRIGHPIEHVINYRQLLLAGMLLIVSGIPTRVLSAILGNDLLI